MAKKDAEAVVNKIALYENCFVNLMVSEELGLSIPQEENDSALLTDAMIMLFSFGGFGLFTLIPFGFVAEGLIIPEDGYIAFVVWSIVIVGIFGASKSAFSNSSAMTMILESVMLSGSCAAVAYFMGKLSMELVDE